METKRTLSMLGDYLRDASVLVLVFFPLEMSKQGPSGITLPILLLIVLVSVTFLLMGIVFEKLGGQPNG